MKKLLCLLTAILVFSSGSTFADYLGIRQATDQIVVPLNEPLNTNGVPGVPDSAYVSTYLGTGTAAQYSVNSTTFPFTGASIDTTVYLTDTLYWFVDAIQDIDGAATGNYTLHGIVTLWTDDLPTHTTFSVQVIGGEIGTYFAYLDASVSSRATASDNVGINLDNVSGTLDAAEIGTDAITATKIAADAIGASEIATDAFGAAELATDAVAEIQSGLPTMVADTVWEESQVAHTTAGSFGAVLDPTTWTSSADVADAVWDESQAGHVTVGTFGYYLDAQISGLGASVWTTGSRDSLLNAASTASLQAKIGALHPTNFADLSITASTGQVTVGTNNDKTGYSLSQSFPANFASLAIDGSGYVTTGTNNDKTGYALSTAGATAIWNIDWATAFTAGSMGDSLSDPNYVQGTASGLTALDVWNVDWATVFTAGSMGDSLSTVAYVRDNVAAADIFTYFDAQDLSNFKATGFSTHSALDVWNLDWATAFTAGSMGDSLSTSAYVQGAASGLTAVDIWNVDWATAFTAGSMGDSLSDPNYVQGTASGLTALDVWNVPFASAFTAGSMGDSLNNVSLATLQDSINVSILQGRGAVRYAKVIAQYNGVDTVDTYALLYPMTTKPTDSVVVYRTSDNARMFKIQYTIAGRSNGSVNVVQRYDVEDIVE